MTEQDNVTLHSKSQHAILVDSCGSDAAAPLLRRQQQGGAASVGCGPLLDAVQPWLLGGGGCGAPAGLPVQPVIPQLPAKQFSEDML